MKTFELTFSIRTTDNSDIDSTAFERLLAHYDNTDLNVVDIDMIEPDNVHVTFEMKAKTIDDCPDELCELNDEDLVDDPELYESELISYTRY